jgi:hypothetical protein
MHCSPHFSGFKLGGSKFKLGGWASATAGVQLTRQEATLYACPFSTKT